MNNRQMKTLEAIFEQPAPANIRWSNVISLFRALGARIVEHEGSRIGVRLGQRVAVFHRPHPSPLCGRGLIRDVREFLESAEIRP
jgi:hypothetical protein